MGRVYGHTYAEQAHGLVGMSRLISTVVSCRCVEPRIIR
jgi:hypothetical protein